jgi:SNF family Na+-dependent transporter
VLNGLGFLWNPGTVGVDLLNPELWLAAASQVFFSLSIGMGVIITYASYLGPKDDVVLSGLTAAAANEVCEVGIGGLMTVPAAFVFLGAAGVVGSTVGLGFIVLPQVFTFMPGGQFFAVLYFSLLFLAAITSSLSMLQPGLALLQEGLGLNRSAAVAVLGSLTAFGTGFVWFFSKDLQALDTIDFWVANVLIFLQASLIIVIWAFIIRYVCPLYLGAIFLLFVVNKVIGWNFRFGSEFEIKRTPYVTNLIGPDRDPVALASVGLIALLTIGTFFLVRVAARRWDRTLASGE